MRVDMRRPQQALLVVKAQRFDRNAAEASEVADSQKLFHGVGLYALPQRESQTRIVEQSVRFVAWRFPLAAPIAGLTRLRAGLASGGAIANVWPNFAGPAVKGPKQEA